MPPQESETIVNVASDGAAGRGADRSHLPDQEGLIKIIVDDTESKVFDIRGLHSVGLTLPAAIAGITGVQIHVAARRAGTYAKIETDAEYTLDASKAVSNTEILTWNYMKLVYVGTATGTGEIPLSFS